MTDKERESTWIDYKNNHSSELREKLIIEYAPLVKVVAGKMMMHLNGLVELDDLCSYGIFGLIDSIDKFELTKGVKFETYASIHSRCL